MKDQMPSDLPPRETLSSSFVISHLLACSMLWGSSFLFIKLIDNSLSPLAIAACRGVIGGCALSLWFMVTGRSPLPRRVEYRHWLILGTFNGWLPNILVAFALTLLASGKAAMIGAAGPLITSVLAHLVFTDEKLGRRRFIGVITGFAGMLMLVGSRAMEGGATLLAVLAMSGVTLCYSIGNIYTKTIKDIAPSRLALGQQVVSGLVATVLVLSLEGSGAFAPVWNNIGLLLLLGVVSTAIPMTIFMKLISKAGPARAAMTGYLVPTWATILGAIVLDERLTTLEIAGGVVVLIGVYVVSATQPAKTSLPP